MSHSAKLHPQKARQFAKHVILRLRKAGYLAYWAGGCVRDQLLGREPKDYDVATDAQPDQIRTLFGRRRTLALGASFGVITLIGPPGAGQIEIATFRDDVGYSDGRHPDRVHFSTAEADASRRDFTINGLFFDPIGREVIDYVGGREDIQRRRIRAIGDPVKRFTEDKLRMLRAVRFSAGFDFQLDPETREAVCRMADQITVVSWERIAAEIRQILTAARRAAGVRLLVDTGLGAAILPELFADERRGAAAGDFEAMLEVLVRLDSPEFPLSLAVLLSLAATPQTARAIGRRWRLANHEINRAAWLLEHRRSLDGADRRRWSSVQPVLVAKAAPDLLKWMQAQREAEGADDADVRWCRDQLSRDRAEIDPAPLLTGDDLIGHGVPKGPIFREILQGVREAQLDGEVHSRREALAMVDRLIARPR
ncbi:MAG: CCA tRNA nucleotidyltransferase [Pirellulaceae bacterium]|jgi:tRNA nucleotidyltransferase/poly(A) polymerase|nr:CCA tRNA nucleotidyltransferase [Thermoguttaceae bacterium]MDI9446588.1 CCA tRNA nucleotidyltransferase [Planctomycetota bacterium]NLY99687.1 CCA tRNA nucleotidyltransferase [Pirellulaceae bacterium]